ncbi:MAG: SUMF1/EgtB/PvdO family nonheme iron enzyme, partial [Planctomycetota bacterium]
SISIALLACGCAAGTPMPVGAGAAGLCLIGRMVERSAASPRSDQLANLAANLLEKCGRYDVSGSIAVSEERPVARRRDTQREPSDRPRPVGQIATPSDLVSELIATSRYALLLRPDSARHLSRSERGRAMAALDEAMAVVPAGSVLVGLAAERATLGHDIEPAAATLDAAGVASVGACYLDRRPITNAEFQQFVDAGGYDQLDLWPEEALPALFDFVDQTSEPGPRFWTNQRHTPGEDRLPVVGISWYEAVSYARWVGKRLPTDAEWTKACAWPIESPPGRIAQRRYPWGESFEPTRANLWRPDSRGVEPVDAYPEGVSVGGVEQMVGNVWEWTNTPLNEATPASVRFSSSLRTVHGGAFDTYFENQATCHFQSGERPLARRANIGFRLALSMSTLGA